MESSLLVLPFHTTTVIIFDLKKCVFVFLLLTVHHLLFYSLSDNKLFKKIFAYSIDYEIGHLFHKSLSFFSNGSSLGVLFSSDKVKNVWINKSIVCLCDLKLIVCYVFFSLRCVLSGPQT